MTRHLDQFLSEEHPQDWDLVILHYLGLDHVGHLGGSKSPLMGPKQEQLDLVIKRIFESISNHELTAKEKTLLLVAGDHGMTDGGNHGGSSEDELSTALLLASPSFNHDGWALDQKIKPEKIQQVDIVPTLAILLGTGIPSASIGVAIQSALNLSFLQPGTQEPDPYRIEMALRNHAKQMIALLQKVLGGFHAARALLNLHSSCETDDLETILNRLDVKNLQAILKRSQQYLLTHFSGYHSSIMFCGLIIMSIATACFLLQGIQKRGTATNQEIMVMILAAVQIASFGSTSFIEEEHEAWFFLGGSSFLILALVTSANRKFQYLFACLLIRVLRAWSQNGQKAGPNASVSFFLDRKPWLCHLMDPFGVYYLIPRSRQNFKDPFLGSLSMICFLVAGILSLTPVDRPFLYLPQDRPFFQDRESRPRWLYITLVSGLGFCLLSQRKQSFLRALRISIFIFLRSLTKSENYLVLWVCWAASDLCHTLREPMDETTEEPESLKGGHAPECPIVCTWMELVFSKCTFFALGGSNSLATVDLSNSYNGLKSFSLPIVTLLTFASNFSGPILIGMNCLILSSSSLPPKVDRPTHSDGLSSRILFRSIYFSFKLLMICILSTHFSHHLFVFSVFSPAVLYGFVWFFGFHLSISLVELLSCLL